MAASWCKVSTDLDGHPKIRRAGRNGREVFLFALRKNSGPGIPVPGVLPASYLEAWYLADQLMMTEADAADGLQRAVNVGLLERVGDKAYRIVGWEDEWGRIPKTSAERQAEFRARQRGDLPATEKKTYAIEQVGTGFVKIGRAANIAQRLYDLQVASPVPLRLLAFSISDVESRLHAELKPHHSSGEWFKLNTDVITVLSSCMTMAVTPPDVTSNGDTVTRNDDSNESKREEIRSEEKRQEEKRLEKTERSASPPARSRSKPSPPELSDDERQAVDRVLTKLSKHSGVAYRNAGTNQKLILSRLRAGYTDEDLRIVVGYCALELNWEQKPNMKPYLRPKTLFGPENFDEYVDPARSWYAAINRQENRTA